MALSQKQILQLAYDGVMAQQNNLYNVQRELTQLYEAELQKEQELMEELAKKDKTKQETKEVKKEVKQVKNEETTKT